MTRRVRGFLFLFLGLIFLLIAPLVVLYSLGWRIDWQKKEIFQTGAFYFKVWPKNCQIYINGKPKKKTDFFFGAAFIDNLLPKKYNIEIKKTGFQTWQKNLKIEEKRVTEAKNIILFPEKPSFNYLGQEIIKFYPLPPKKEVILLEKNKNPDEKEGWALKIFNLENNLKSHLVDDKQISKKEKNQFSKLEISPDYKRLILETKIKTKKTEKTKYYILKIEEGASSLVSLSFIKENFDKIVFLPKSQQKLLGFKDNQLFEINLENKKISKPLIKDILAFFLSKDKVYYLDNSGFVYQTDFSFRNPVILNQTTFNIKEGADYQLKLFNSYLFLKENDVLYFFNEKEQRFEKILESLRGFVVSPDLKRAALWSDHEIWVLFLQDVDEQPKRKKGEKIFLTRFGEKITNLFWITNHYLLFSVGEEIKIIEIDNRDRINNFVLGKFKTPEIIWSNLNKILFVLSENNLYFLKDLVP